MKDSRHIEAFVLSLTICDDLVVWLCLSDGACMVFDGERGERANQREKPVFVLDGDEVDVWFVLYCVCCLSCALCVALCVYVCCVACVCWLVGRGLLRACCSYGMLVGVVCVWY